MQTMFLAFTVLTALAIAITMMKLEGRVRTAALLGLSLWLIYVGSLSYFGVIANAKHGVPGSAFIVIPIFLFITLFLTRSETVARMALAIPISLLLGAQVFRVIVEIFLHQLAGVGLVPRMMTFEGANFDIVTGLSAPIVAWAYGKGHLSVKQAILWNIFGLFMLANVMIRAIMTTPGPLHQLVTEVPNLAIGIFPYSFIPGLMLPLAITLHVLAIHSLRASLRV